MTVVLYDNFDWFIFLELFVHCFYSYFRLQAVYWADNFYLASRTLVIDVLYDKTHILMNAVIWTYVCVKLVKPTVALR